jgi:hypothetical protein
VPNVGVEDGAPNAGADEGVPNAGVEEGVPKDGVDDGVPKRGEEVGVPKRGEEVGVPNMAAGIAGGEVAGWGFRVFSWAERFEWRKQDEEGDFCKAAYLVLKHVLV